MNAPARRELIGDVPDRIKALPIGPNGFPVPWFVTFIDGVPDFRIVTSGRIVSAVREHRCWICGQRLGVHLAFVIGPMCVVNRVTSEPPQHRDCAGFAVANCPFLTHPGARYSRRERPAETRDAAGLPLHHNPGASAIWLTKSFKPFRVDDGYLFSLGTPDEVLWFTRGRTASRGEIEAAMARGLPKLEEAARMEGPEAMAALDHQYTAALPLLPAA